MRFFIRLILIFLVLLVPSASSKNTHPLYEKLDLFSDVLEKINKEYVTDIDQSKVIDAAINGMLQSLDPYSAYMNPESYRNMNIETKGEFGGLGIEITMESGFIKVINFKSSSSELYDDTCVIPFKAIKVIFLSFTDKSGLIFSGLFKEGSTSNKI